VCLVHKLEILVDYGLQEFPMCLEEARILADDIHNVGSHDSLIILSTLHLSEPKEVLDDGHEETLLRLFICDSQYIISLYDKETNLASTLTHRTTDRPYCPTQRVKIGPRPGTNKVSIALLDNSLRRCPTIQSHRFVLRVFPS
jgi:hypothetical protein